MKKGLSIAVSTFVLLFILNANAEASTTLGRFSNRFNLVNPSVTSVSFEGSFFLRSRIPVNENGSSPPPDKWMGWDPPIFDLTLDSSLVGTTWYFDSNDDGFKASNEALINGIDDVFAFRTSSWGFNSESSLFEPNDNYHQAYNGSNGFDFAGYTIDQISFTLNAFNPGSVDDEDVQYTVEIIGSSVPIPGTLWLLGSGVLGIVGIRSRSKKLS